MAWEALGSNAEKALAHYLLAPVDFVEDLLLAGRVDEHGKQIGLDDKQKETLNALAVGDWPVLQKARGTGGTAVISWACLWWLYVHPTAKIVTTAPKVEQDRKSVV